MSGSLSSGPRRSSSCSGWSRSCASRGAEATGPAGGAQRAAGRTADQGGQQGADGANRLRSTATAMRRRGRTRPRKRSRHRMGTQVVNNPDQYRYEIYVDDTLAGFAQYHRQSGVVTFTHTEIDPDYEGQGLGSVLARSALDELRGSDEQVVPLCPFIAGYIRRHRQYVDLVVPERRVAFQQPTAGQ